MSIMDRLAEGFPAMSTRAELDQRIRDRAVPAAELNLTPDGPETPTVHAQTALSNEQRIDHLEGRLDHEHRKIETDHTFARLHGKARADFGMAED